MLLLAAFEILISRYTGQKEFLIGTPVANRNRAETEGLIGFFINTLVLRADLKGDPLFPDLLSRVRKTTLDAYTYQDWPFERNTELIPIERDLSRNPLIQIMFVFQKYTVKPVRAAWFETKTAFNTDYFIEVRLNPFHVGKRGWFTQHNRV